MTKFCFRGKTAQQQRGITEKIYTVLRDHIIIIIRRRRSIVLGYVASPPVLGLL